MKKLLFLIWLFPILALAQPSGEVDPFSIRKDGTIPFGPTTAIIPFAEGLSMGDADTFLIGDASGSYGTGQGRLRMFDSVFQGVRRVELAVINGPSSGSSDAPDIYFEAASTSGTATGAGGDVSWSAGSAAGTSGHGGSIYFLTGAGKGAGRTGGLVLLKGGSASGGATYGYVGVGDTATPNKFTLSSSNTQSSLYVIKDLEVDGTVYFDGALNVVGTTTLDTALTGILKATAGVVAVASASDLVTAIGDADDDATTKGVSTYVDNDFNAVAGLVSINQAGTFSWTGDHTFSNSIAVTPFNDEFSQFGPDSDLNSPGDTSDRLAVVKQSDETTSGAKRGGLFSSEFIGTTNSSKRFLGLNAFGGTTSASTANLTTTGSGGAAVGGRYISQHDGSGTVSLGGAVTGRAQGGTYTDAYTFYSEGGNVDAAKTFTRYSGLWITDGSGSGTITGQFGVRIDDLNKGSSFNYAIALSTDQGIYFRTDSSGGGTEYMYSSAASTLDDSANTTRNFRIGGTIEALINSSSFQSLNDITIFKSSPNIILDDSGVSDDWAIRSGGGAFSLINTTDTRTVFATTAGGAIAVGSAVSGTSLTYNVTTASNHQFQVNSATEVTIAADVATFNSGSDDPTLNWATDGALQIRNGRFAVEAGNASSAVAQVGGTIEVNVTGVGNVGVGEDNLQSYSLPANTLSTNNDRIDIKAAGTFAASVNSKRVRCYFGSTAIFDSGVLAITAATDWVLNATVIRTGATTQEALAYFNTSSATLSAYADYTAPGETLSGAVTVKCTGEATADNDVTQELFVIDWMPAQ